MFLGIDQLMMDRYLPDFALSFIKDELAGDRKERSATWVNEPYFTGSTWVALKKRHIGQV